MVKVHHTVTFREFFFLSWSESRKKITLSHQVNRMDDGLVSMDSCQDGTVVVRGQKGKKLGSEAGSEHGERVPLVILLFGKLEDGISICSPLISQIKLHSTSREKHTIDLSHQSQDLCGIGKGVNGHDLSSRHFNKFHIGSRNVARFRCRSVRVGLSEDANDWVLRRQVLADCEDAQQGKQEY